MLNYFSKIFFAIYAYIFYLADALSSDCLEVTNLPWYLLFILSSRIGCISQISTFLCMSIAKVILNWRPDIYLKLNSNFCVNLATMFVMLYNLIDLCIRIDLHIYNDCYDNLARSLYQFELQRDFCIPNSFDISVNMTICEIYEQTKDVYPIGCKTCHPNPTMRILLAFVVLMEFIKFCLGFSRIAKKYGKKSMNKKIHAKNQDGNNTSVPYLSSFHPKHSDNILSTQDTQETQASENRNEVQIESEDTEDPKQTDSLDPKQQDFNEHNPMEKIEVDKSFSSEYNDTQTFQETGASVTGKDIQIKSVKTMDNQQTENVDCNQQEFKQVKIDIHTPQETQDSENRKDVQKESEDTDDPKQTDSLNHKQQDFKEHNSIAKVEVYKPNFSDNNSTQKFQETGSSATGIEVQIKSAKTMDTQQTQNFGAKQQDCKETNTVETVRVDINTPLDLFAGKKENNTCSKTKIKPKALVKKDMPTTNKIVLFTEETQDNQNSINGKKLENKTKYSNSNEQNLESVTVDIHSQSTEIESSKDMYNGLSKAIKGIESC